MSNVEYSGSQAHTFHSVELLRRCEASEKRIADLSLSAVSVSPV